jgi:hypothetical protein
VTQHKGSARILRPWIGNKHFLKSSKNRYDYFCNDPVLPGAHHGHSGDGPSFATVDIAPATEKADKTSDVNSTNLAVVLFTEISPPL